MIPTPKYSVGDVVWCARAVQHSKRVPCPDCLDQGKWHVTTPAGEALEARCPRCSGGYSVPTPKMITYEPVVERLTIGSVQINTADEEAPVHYMCHETGIGSGAVYKESQLYPTEGEANAAAQFIAQKLAKELREHNPAVRAADLVAKMTWTSALVKKADDRRIETELKLGRIMDVITDSGAVNDGKTLGQIAAIIEE